MAVGLLIITHKRIGEGVLVLSDMFGSTASNSATRLRGPMIRVVTGINLPMLMRAMNYPSLNLHELVNKASTGGHDGSLVCESESHRS